MPTNRSAKMDWLGLETRLREIIRDTGSEYTPAEAVVRMSAALAAYTMRGDVLDPHTPVEQFLAPLVGDFDSVQLDEWTRAEGK